jgi:phosphoglycolate phosphatase
VTRFIVFDLDGTLVDSRRDLANAANALITELGGTPLPEEAVAAMVGEGAAILVRRALIASGLDASTPAALSRFLDLYDERLLEHTRPYDGIFEVLQSLHARVPIAVLTNKPQAATEKLLAGLQLASYFRDVIGGDTPLGRKPGPAGLLELARRAGVPPSETVLVGDSPIDFETARAAGCGLVLVRYGFGFRELDLRRGERVLTQPGELANLFRSAPSNAD